MSSESEKGMYKIHNVRFYNLTPRAINFIAYNKQSSKLAVSRNDASIEIWDIKNATNLEKTILGSPAASVESIGWGPDNRLFSTGHTGELIEWDMKSLAPKQKLLLTGNHGWCLDVNKALDCVAIGTEEGYVNVYRLENNEIIYEKLFDKQEGRIICCKYDHTGSILVTGSMDTVRIWNTKTGQAMFRMNTGRQEAKKETIVWSLAVLRDLTIISGDSRGRIIIWDGKMGTQIESIPVLKADVLAVDVNEDENVFCCSGIDPIIKMYAMTEVKKENHTTNQWIKFIQRSVHDHDVKALKFIGKNKVYSGGIDGYLGVSYSTKTIQKLTKYGPFLPEPCTIAMSSRLILLKYFNYLEIWKLGEPSENVQLCDDENVTNKFLNIEKHLVKLIELRSHNDEPIISAIISSNGKWLIYSTNIEIRIFRIEIYEDTAKLLRYKENLPTELTECKKLIVSSKNYLFHAKQNGQVNVFKLTNDGDVEYRETIDTSKFIKDTIISMRLSECGKYFVCVGACCNVAVWKATKNRQSFKHLVNLPKYHLPPTAITIHRNVPKLVAAFSDFKIFEYDLEELKFTCSTKPSENSPTHAPLNVVLDPQNDNIVMLHNEQHLYVYQKVQIQKSNKMKRKNDDETKSSDKLNCFILKTTKCYEHFVHFDWLSDNELVAVGVNPVTLIEQLPPTLKLKKFGAA